MSMNGYRAETATDTSTTNFSGITVVNTSSLLNKPHVKQSMAAISAYTQKILSRSVVTKSQTTS